MIIDGTRAWSIAELDRASAGVASTLLAESADLGGARVAFYVPPSFEYLATLLGIWKAGGLAVPLALSYPLPELAYILQDSGASILVTTAEAAGRLHPIADGAGARLILAGEAMNAPARPAEGFPALRPERRAMMLYTSGTTGKPKGVVTTHANVAAQIEAMIEAWEWSARDRTLLVLPLHHVHGLINVVFSALWSGATLEVHARFEPEATWDRLASGELTVFTAVPTIYHQLIASWDASSPEVQRARSEGCRAIRLMMSGSAALPVRVLDRWREISGHTLLERYGMTEIGMALANPLHGARRPGFVGTPLPHVQIRLVDDRGAIVPDGTAGEIEVRGPGVFHEYWQQPDATAESFRNGWFRTGDVAVRDDGVYRLLGRSSIDIIKTGGYKVSALEIEEVLRRHPAVADCAVVGLDDEEWGQRIAAAVEVRPGVTFAADDLDRWVRQELAPYKIPRAVQVVRALPRNAMGKIVKPRVVEQLTTNNLTTNN